MTVETLFSRSAGRPTPRMVYAAVKVCILAAKRRFYCEKIDSRLLSPVQFSPFTDGIEGGHEERFSRDPLPIFSAGGPCEHFWHGQGCPLFDVAHQKCPLPTMASPTFQGALKDDFGEAVVECDLPEPCKLSLIHI